MSAPPPFLLRGVWWFEGLSEDPWSVLSVLLRALKVSYALVLLLLSFTFLTVRIQRLDSISKNVSSTSTAFRPRTIGFFHPFTSDGGGGERVLWQMVKLMREKYPMARVVIYTGDGCAKKEEKKRLLERAKERFSVDIKMEDDSVRERENANKNAPSLQPLSPSIEFKRVYFRTLTQSKWYPVATILGQMVGIIVVAVEAISGFAPDVFVDTIGAAWAYPFIWFFCGESTKIVSYVHYPTISSDMCERVKKGSLIYNNGALFSEVRVLKQMKIFYYTILMSLYGYCGGSFADVIVVNSSWTKNHIDRLWGTFAKKRARRTKVKLAPRRENEGQAIVVYPPCDVSSVELRGKETVVLSSSSSTTKLIQLKKRPPPLSSPPDVDDGEEKLRQNDTQDTPYVKKAKRLVLGEYKVPHFSAIAVGQFRPEKNHKLLLESWKLMKTNVETNRHPACETAVLKLVGGLRDKNDLQRYNALKRMVKEMGIEDSVEFYHDVDNATLKELLQQSIVGLHAMTDEHFGICIVEYMAFGAVPIAHNSGGPKMDIIQHGVDGFLASDVASYAAVLEGVFSMNDEKLGEMIENGKRKSLQFSEENFNAGMFDALKSMGGFAP